MNEESNNGKNINKEKNKLLILKLLGNKYMINSII